MPCHAHEGQGLAGPGHQAPRTYQLRHHQKPVRGGVLIDLDRVGVEILIDLGHMDVQILIDLEHAGVEM